MSFGIKFSVSFIETTKLWASTILYGNVALLQYCFVMSHNIDYIWLIWKCLFSCIMDYVAMAQILLFAYSQSYSTPSLLLHVCVGEVLKRNWQERWTEFREFEAMLHVSFSNALFMSHTVWWFPCVQFRFALSLGFCLLAYYIFYSSN